MKTIIPIYEKIMQSEIFRLNGSAIDLPAALIQLGNAVHGADAEEIDWGLGEWNEADLAALVVGAYWSLTQWHAGQSSPSYAALCSLGRVFSPGMTSGPEEGSGEFCAYELCNAWLERGGDSLIK